jgi:hypothetical protein
MEGHNNTYGLPNACGLWMASSSVAERKYSQVPHGSAVLVQDSTVLTLLSAYSNCSSNRDNYLAVFTLNKAD